MVDRYLVCPSSVLPDRSHAHGRSSAGLSLPCTSDSSCPSRCPHHSLSVSLPSGRLNTTFAQSLTQRLVYESHRCADVVTIDPDLANAIRHLTVEGYSGDATSGFDNVSESYALPDSDISDDSSQGITFDAPKHFIYKELISRFQESLAPSQTRVRFLMLST